MPYWAPSVLRLILLLLPSAPTLLFFCSQDSSSPYPSSSFYSSPPSQPSPTPPSIFHLLLCFPLFLCLLLRPLVPLSPPCSLSNSSSSTFCCLPSISVVYPPRHSPATFFLIFLCPSPPGLLSIVVLCSPSVSSCALPFFHFPFFLPYFFSLTPWTPAHYFLLFLRLRLPNWCQWVLLRPRSSTRGELRSSRSPLAPRSWISSCRVSVHRL